MNRERKILFLVVFLIASLSADICPAASHDFFFVVHCEAEKKQYIDRDFHLGLKPLVYLADKNGIKLTISLSPQWADYIAENKDRQQMLAAWIGQGHEIGVLHYGLKHQPTWDYYSNEINSHRITSAGRNPALRQGAMLDLVNKINSLLASESIKTPGAKQVSMSELDYDVDLTRETQLKYLTYGSRISEDFLDQDVVKKPVQQTVNGVSYWKLSMGYFTVIQKRVSKGYITAQLRRRGLGSVAALWPGSCEKSEQLQNLLDLYRSFKQSAVTKNVSDYKFGLVTHPLDFMGDDAQNGGCGYLEEWFRFISERIHEQEMTSKTVSGILDRYTRGAPVKGNNGGDMHRKSGLNTTDSKEL